MKLFHGSYEANKPEIKIGKFALGARDNVFDGIFAASCQSVAESHGDYIHVYEVEAIATNADLYCETGIKALSEELGIDEELADNITWAVAQEKSLADYREYLDPRSEYDCDDLGWEMQRLRGVIARSLGFGAVECTDEHGTSYLVVQ